MRADFAISKTKQLEYVDVLYPNQAMTEKTTGFFIIDKPAGITSHDVVDQVRKITGIKRVGHTGTLDPFATGILLVTVGSTTRLAQYTNDLPKTYEATIVLGASSDTDDMTGKITSISNYQPTEQEITETLKTFIGKIEQTPPAYAAIKVKGKKLYEYARAGQAIAVPPRSVTIHSLELVSYVYPEVRIQAVVLSGTYIRALGRDIGQSLKTGAYLLTLSRTAIGNFNKKKSIQLKQLANENWIGYLHPPKELTMHLPMIILDDLGIAKLQQGKKVYVESKIARWPNKQQELSDTCFIAVMSKQQFIGIATYHQLKKYFAPKTILNLEG